MREGHYDFEQLCTSISVFSDCMDDYPYVMDLQNDRYFISEKAVKRFAVPTSEFSDVVNMHRLFVYEQDFDMLQMDLEEMIAGVKDHHNLEYRWVDKENKPVWINCRGRILKDKKGKPRFMVGCVNEIGLEARADNLSGFLQSTALTDMCVGDSDKLNVSAVLRIGVDGFKSVNETFGNKYGDKVLRDVAKSITNCIGERYKAYHVVSDEYLVVDTFAVSDEEEMHELYRKIRREIDHQIEINNYEAIYTISGGIVVTDDMENPTYSNVMKYSEFALAEAKNLGKNQAYIFDKNDYDVFLRRRKILVEMRKSIANNYEGFRLVFQPIMTGGENGGKLYAAETLVRFTTSEGEFLTPYEFIPILEESGLIIPVGRWIIDTAFKMCKECQKYNPDFKITINLSYVQILKSAIQKEVINAIAKYSLKPESIIMEMTESGYLEDSPRVKRVWNNFKKFGVLIAIDDFGTGYSNLSSISKLRPDVVKIDRAFTMKALSNSYENQLMANIIELVHSINLKICLEGVETSEELDKLNVMRPNYIQGYYYSKPCEPEEFMEKFIIK